MIYAVGKLNFKAYDEIAFKGLSSFLFNIQIVGMYI